MLLRQLMEMNENQDKHIFASIDGRIYQIFGVESIRDFHDKLAREVADVYKHTSKDGTEMFNDSPSHLKDMSPREMYQETLNYLSDMSRAHDNFFDVVGNARRGAEQAWWSDLTSEMIDDIMYEVTHEDQ